MRTVYSNSFEYRFWWVVFKILLRVLNANHLLAVSFYDLAHHPKIWDKRRISRFCGRIGTNLLRFGTGIRCVVIRIGVKHAIIKNRRYIDWKRREGVLDGIEPAVYVAKGNN